MQITLTADYAVRAVVHIAARAGGQCLPAGEIAAAQNIPRVYVSKVLQALARAGIVTCVAGRRGGAKLARRASDISLLDIVEAVDGPVVLNRCVRRPGECSRDGTCTVHAFWNKAQRSLRKALAGAKVSSFCPGRPKRRAPGK
jgi:Rrf2 family iron-sulfur cluster assembly transcriptional regulator